MILLLKDFYKNVVTRFSYWGITLLFSITAYGFSMLNRTISIDDLAKDLYIGRGQKMLAGTRWGMELWHNTLGVTQVTPFIEKFFGVLFLMVAATLVSCIFYLLGGKSKCIMRYTILSVLLITYPLINEIWEYSGANMIVAGNLCIVAGTVLYQITNSQRWYVPLISGVALSVVASSYETGIFVYVTLVLMILFYKYCFARNNAKKKCQWIYEGLHFSIPLFIALGLRIVIGISLLKIYGLTYVANGESTLKWEFTFSYVKNLIEACVDTYIVSGLVYYPITIFVILTVVFVVIFIWLGLRRKKLLACVLGICILGSLFLQVVVQGAVMPYRNANTLSLFVAFVGFLILHISKKWSKIAMYACLLLCLHQSIYLHQILALNNQRSENELAVVRQVGFRLKSEFEHKPIIFVGNYDMGEWLYSRVSAAEDTINGKLYSKITGKRKYIDTNINSALNWSIQAFGNQNMMKEYFAYCGYDIQLVQENATEKYYEAKGIAEQNNMKAFEILEQEDYLIISIGEF